MTSYLHFPSICHILAAIITEANRAFRFNANMFTCIDYQKTVEVEPIKKDSTLTTTGASLAALLAVLLAVSGAHFFLVVGGYTGSAGGQKLETVFNWLRTGLTSKL